ncbi:choice-of-anchor M domain-containing protein [Dactylosporangium sp. NPDC005572]|uniref:choice-of-anchor M domain-containing protein n=1 Tax=Dactylosporangium sp. NPDC005572 TaxID=3156889 RepID=UPI00339E3B3F
MRRSIAAAALSVVTAAGTVLTGAGVAEAAEPVVLSKGHTDAVDVHYEGGALTLKVHDDTVEPSRSLDPADVTFQALPASATQVPDHPLYAFLGAPGTTVWMLPQIQDEKLLWPGWNTTTLTTGVFDGDKVKISLVDVEGPGSVWVFTVGALGDPTVKFGSPDGLPDVLDVPVRTHAHANWVFSAQGTYTLKFQAEATLKNGTVLNTGPIDYKFVVGPLTGPDPDPATQLAITGLAPSYLPGAQVALTATQNPVTDLDDYHWFSKCPGATEFAVIPGEGGGTYTFTATEQLDGCQYLVKLYDESDAVVAQSAPVALQVGDDQPDPQLWQTITATVDDSNGALVVSVDPNDREVGMSPIQLAESGDRLEAIGQLRPVTVTDTRTAKPGWNVSGQVSDFRTDGGASFGGKYLGWLPKVLAQVSGQGAVPGDPVWSGFEEGNGLAESCLLGSAAADTGRGTARFGADLRLELPTDTAGGTYQATLTLTAI